MNRINLKKAEQIILIIVFIRFQCTIEALQFAQFQVECDGLEKNQKHNWIIRKRFLHLFGLITLDDGYCTSDLQVKKVGANKTALAIVNKKYIVCNL